MSKLFLGGKVENKNVTRQYVYSQQESMSACVGAWLSAEFALSWIYVQATREAGANAHTQYANQKV